MNQFTIKDIENLCGIKAHTLRIWEERYKFFIPKRKESRHRTYDSEDLKELLRISFLYHNGYKISRIAQLSPAQIQQEVASIKPQSCNYEIFIHQLIEASILLDKENFEQVLNGLLLRIGLEKCILHVFYPFLQRIGLLWMTNHVIPAQEHFSSNIIRQKIICGIDGLEETKNRKYNIVVFSTIGELHEIPLLFVNYLLRKQGLRTTYFGINVSVETLIYYAQHHTVSHFYSHLITKIASLETDEYISSLCRNFPDKQIIISGPACNGVQKKFPNLLHLKSFDEVGIFIQSLSEPAQLI